MEQGSGLGDRKVDLALRLLFWVWIAYVVRVPVWHAVTWFLTRDSPGDPARIYLVTSLVFGAISLALGGVVVLALVFVAARVDRKAAAWTWAALGGQVVMMAFTVVNRAIRLLEVPAEAQQLVWLVHAILWLAAWLLLGAALLALARSRGVRVPGWLVAVVLLAQGACVALDAVQMLWLVLRLYGERGWLGAGFDMATSIASVGADCAFALGLFELRRRLRAQERQGERAARPASVDVPGEWLAGADGLALLRGAVLARLGVVVFGGVMLFVVSRSGTAEGTKGALVLFTLAGLATTVVMLVGVARFCAIPAAGGAVVALVLMVVGTLVDGYSLVLVFRLFDGSLSAALDLERQAPWVQGIAGTVAIAALVVLLGAFRALARWLRDEELAARTVAVSWLAGGAGAGMLLLLAAISHRVIPAALGAALALVGLIAALVALVSFLLIARDLEMLIRRPPLRAAPSSPARPPEAPRS